MTPVAVLASFSGWPLRTRDRVLAACEGAPTTLMRIVLRVTADEPEPHVADVEHLREADDLALAVRPDHRSRQRGRRDVDGRHVRRAVDVSAEGVTRNDVAARRRRDADEDVVVLALDERHERVPGRQPPDRAQALRRHCSRNASVGLPPAVTTGLAGVTRRSVEAVLEDELEPFSSFGSSKASTATSTTARTTRMIFLRRLRGVAGGRAAVAHACLDGGHQGVPPAATAEIEVEESGVPSWAWPSTPLPLPTRCT